MLNRVLFVVQSIKLCCCFKVSLYTIFEWSKFLAHYNVIIIATILSCIIIILLFLPVPRVYNKMIMSTSGSLCINRLVSGLSSLEHIMPVI